MTPTAWKELTKALKINQTLESLDLSGNAEANQSMRDFGDALKHNHTLQSLNLAKCDIQSAMMTKLIEGMEACGTLTSVDVSGNSLISRAPIYALSNWLSHDTVLLRLNLTYCGLNKKTFEYLQPGLAANKTLKELRLIGPSENYHKFANLYNTGNSSLKVWLATHNPALAETLEVGRETPNEDASHDWEDKFNLKFTQDTNKFSFRELNNIHIGEEGALWFASKRFDLIKHVTSINLSYTLLGNEGIKAICERLAGATELRTIKLVWSSLEDADASSIADLLRRNHSITKIDLMDNRLTHDGATIIADALRDSSLKIVNLNGLHFTSDKAHTTLCQALKENKTITDLHLCCPVPFSTTQ